MRSVEKLGMSGMGVLLAAAALGAVATLGTSGVAAQTVPGGSNKAALANVPRACNEEITRFCPVDDMQSVDARGAYICLRPYKTSASTACRRAIEAASR